MFGDLELHATLGAMQRQRGDGHRFLRIGDTCIRLEGLDRPLAVQLERRWGGFLSPAARGNPFYTVRLLDSDDGWLERAAAGERYRIEALNDPAHRVVVSYNFALRLADRPDLWQAAVHEGGSEPVERIVENVMRYLTARLALEQGGFAMHAAGVLRAGRASVLAGPSRAGKTTAVALSAPASSLGDDMAVVVPKKVGWCVPALPFDNAERIDHEPPEGLFPLAGIWRLHQAGRSRVEHPSRILAVASLMGCTAFPWALPEFAGLLLERVRRVVTEGLFAHLHFRKDADLWTQLD